jgi:two-component system cell cycle sensor histidine kinase/response regulator CckA
VTRGLRLFPQILRPPAPAPVAGLLRSLDEPAAFCAPDGLVLEANEAWRGLAGEGARSFRIGGALYAAFRDAARTGRGAGRLKLGGGEREVAVAAAGPEGFLLRVRDGAPQQKPGPAGEGEALLGSGQRRKMEAVGQLAGGVAHDFNNLLSAIGMRVDELLLRHPVGDPAYESLTEIREGVNRAAALVFQLLTFSRKATVRRESVDLGETLVNFEILLRRLLREDMRLETGYAPGTPLVRVDKGQLEMAVMNLVVNARDAMRDRARGSGGTIRLRTARLSPAEAAALGHPGPVAADVALIEIADDGPGIPPEVLDSIFDPFFTTKAAGEGTGLGLATVYGIVRQSEGAIVALSPPGQGAIFRIFLPEHTPEAALEPVAAPLQARAAPRDLSGAGHILFVEDEDRVRDIAARLLRARGYQVTEARDGEEALGLIKAAAGGFDLMISDVSMPGMDGPELLKAARPYLGAAPVMFISGYAESEFSALLEGEADISFLPKPLQLQSLAERVKQRLGAG